MQIRGVGVEYHTLCVFGETLDVDHCNFCFARRSVLSLIDAELFHEFFAAIGGVDHQTSRFKLLSGLFEQVESVYDKVELSHFVLTSKIVIEHISEVVGQRGFPTSLRVPHKTGTNALRKFALYRHRCKELLITHDMLLISRFDLAVHFSFHTHIGYAIAQQIEQAFGAAH